VAIKKRRRIVDCYQHQERGKNDDAMGWQQQFNINACLHKLHSMIMGFNVSQDKNHNR
jgi:hypothetical protein